MLGTLAVTHRTAVFSLISWSDRNFIILIGLYPFLLEGFSRLLKYSDNMRHGDFKSRYDQSLITSAMVPNNKFN